MRFIVDITPSGTVPVPQTPDEMAEDLLTYLTSAGTLAYPPWILSVDDVEYEGP